MAISGRQQIGKAVATQTGLNNVTVAIGGGGGSAGVSSFNNRTGAVTLTANDVTDALNYVPPSPNDLAHVAFTGAFGDLINTPTLVDSFNNRTGAVALEAGDVQPITDPLYVPQQNANRTDISSDTGILIQNGQYNYMLIQDYTTTIAGGGRITTMETVNGRGSNIEAGSGVTLTSVPPVSGYSSRSGLNVTWQSVNGTNTGLVILDNWQNLAATPASVLCQGYADTRYLMTANSSGTDSAFDTVAGIAYVLPSDATGGIGITPNLSGGIGITVRDNADQFNESAIEVNKNMLAMYSQSAGGESISAAYLTPTDFEFSLQSGNRTMSPRSILTQADGDTRYVPQAAENVTIDCYQAILLKTQRCSLTLAGENVVIDQTYSDSMPENTVLTRLYADSRYAPQSRGFTGYFTTSEGQTVTVENGIITNIS